jgi:hypothetical protein
VRQLAQHLIDRASEGDRAIARARRRVAAAYGSLFVAALAIVVASVVLVRVVRRGPELSHGRPTSQSSSYPQCAPPAYRCGIDLLFHTNTDAGPWWQVDLGPDKSVSSVQVENRADCCKDRAVPLIVELSDDARVWREIARQNDPFDEWTATFPRQPARHLRLRVPRTTAFHLKHVSVY